VDRAIRPPVVEARRPPDAAVDCHEDEAGQQHEAGEIERQLVDEIEAALPEIPVKDRPREVGVDPENGRAEEEREEAIEDEEVANAGEAVTATDPPVREHDARHDGEAGDQLPR
jgi:copper chaperone CopZ